jgi:hypothetical protein
MINISKDWFVINNRCRVREFGFQQENILYNSSFVGSDIPKSSIIIQNLLENRNL